MRPTSATWMATSSMYSATAEHDPRPDSSIRRTPPLGAPSSIVSRLRRSMLVPDIKLICISAAALCPVAAYGSFGGTPCRDDFACHFLMWGGLLGVVGGIPISGVVFILLHLRFCHRARSKVRQLLLGGFSSEWLRSRFPRLALRSWAPGGRQPLVTTKITH